MLNARRLYSKLHARIAVSEAARWTAERFCGGHYRIVPNGVDLSAAPVGPKPDADHLRLLFVGRAEERKGLPILLRAFEALRGAGVAARLTVAGATEEEVEPYLLDLEGVDVRGRVSDEEKWRLLHRADLVCAPSLGGESFGMVLTEAFAAGTPVVCSDIAGYREVVRPGHDCVSVPAGDAAALGEAVHALALDPARRARMSEAARESAERFAWPTVTGEVLEVYEDAIERAVAAPTGRVARLALRAGMRPADGLPRNPPRRIPSIEPELPGAGRRRATRAVRRVAVTAGAAGGLGLAVLALQRIGIDSIVQALVAATPWWVLVAFALMCASMLARAESWHAILRAALPGARVRRRHAVRGVMIGVLMSATLPARLGEPSRALIVARRLGACASACPWCSARWSRRRCSTWSRWRSWAGSCSRPWACSTAREGARAGGHRARGGAVPGGPRAGRSSQGRAVAIPARPAVGRQAERRDGRGAARTACLPQPQAGRLGGVHAAHGVGDPVGRLLRAAGRPRLGHTAGLGAAAAVLFAVNVTAVIPATPSNIGVFQAACVAVLSAYGVNHTDALAYGIILQAVEIATAFALGMPSLVGEGMSWKDLRLRALHTAPVELRRHGARATAPKPRPEPGGPARCAGSWTG